MNATEQMLPLGHMAFLAGYALFGKGAGLPLLHGIFQGLSIDGVTLGKLMAGGAKWTLLQPWGDFPVGVGLAVGKLPRCDQTTLSQVASGTEQSVLSRMALFRCVISQGIILLFA